MQVTAELNYLAPESTVLRRFADPAGYGAHPRHSIEYRTIAYFE